MLVVAAWFKKIAGLHEAALDGDLTVHVARSFRERRRGLAKMAPLPDDHALRILKCNSVHTFGLRVDRDVAPRRMKWCLRAGSVVETCAGQGERFAVALADGV